MRSSRRTALFIGWATLVAPAAGAPAPYAQEPRDELAERAAIVRSIDASDEDFADLQPLAEAIGNARVVQLGESSHGAGATFAAKVRLVKFLHQRMGFDVLVWESGLFDLSRVNADLAAGVEPASALRGVFTIWSRTAEVAPLFAYAGASHATDRPLEMAGFDLQFSGRQDEYDEALRDFFQPIQGAPSGIDVDARISEASEAYERVSRRREDGPGGADLEAFAARVDALAELVAEHRSMLVAAHGERHTGLMERSLVNWRLFGENMYTYVAPGLPAEGPERQALGNAAWNRRDTRNADIFQWLLDDYYAGRKLIVWAHNGHIMNAYYAADWSSLSHDPQAGGMKPTGVFLNESIGDDVYTVGFTAYEGEQRQQGGSDVLPVETAPPGSLEQRLHELGHPYLFLDLRSLDNQPDHWLRQPMTMAIRGYMPEQMQDWTRVIDGLFFIDRMTPSTLLGR